MIVTAKFLPSDQFGALIAVSSSFNLLREKFEEAAKVTDEHFNFISFTIPDTWEEEAERFKEILMQSEYIQSVEILTVKRG